VPQRLLSVLQVNCLSSLFSLLFTLQYESCTLLAILYFDFERINDFFFNAENYVIIDHCTSRLYYICCYEEPSKCSLLTFITTRNIITMTFLPFQISKFMEEKQEINFIRF